LIAADLLAHRAPLAQVLSLSDATMQRRDGGLMQFGELLRSLAGSPETETTDTRRLP